MRLGQRLGVGNTAAVYEWGDSQVIKMFHDSLDAVHEARKEARKAEAVRGLSVRAPEFGGMLEYAGKTCLLYEKITGPTMLAIIEPTADSITTYARMMAELHAELHQVEAGQLSNLRTSLEQTIRRTESLSQHEQALVLNTLERMPDGYALCHYDFHPGNIIMSPQGPFIIDWMNSLVGYRCADVMRTWLMLQSGAVPPEAPSWLTAAHWRQQFGEEYIRAYCELTGVTRDSIEEWRIATLAARLHELRGAEQQEILTKLSSLLQQA